MTTKQKIMKKLGSAAAVVLAMAVGAAPYLLFREQIQSMAAVGYVGLFVACMLTNASVFLPASSIAFTMAAATALNPLLCALIGGLGTTAGEMVGYVLGRCGRGCIDDQSRFRKVEDGLRRYGAAAILVFAFMPLPLFDLIGVVAGTVKYPVVKFVVVCALGKILKMLLYVFVLVRFLPV